MLLYIAATHQVLSTVLVVEREQDGHKFPLQKPVYYVSTVLTPMQIPGPPLSKDSIRGLHGITKATTLLPGVFNHAGL